MLIKQIENMMYFHLAITDISEPPTEFIQKFYTNLDSSIINIIAGLTVLIFGLLLSAIIASAIHNLLKWIQLDNRIITKLRANSIELENFQLDKWISIGVFVLIFGITLLAFLEALQFSQITTPINNSLENIYSYLPNFIAATCLLIIAWIFANTVKLAAARSIDFFRLDERLNNQIENPNQENSFSVSRTISEALYWFILLFFLPIILDTLGFQGALQPIETLLEGFLLYLPNIIGAILIGTLGWFAAKTAGKIASTFLISLGIDRFGARFANSSKTQSSLSSLGGTFVSVLILIPTAIAILNKLNIEAVSEPATAVLSQVFVVLPSIFTALIILTIGYITSKYVAEFVTNTLTSINFDNLILNRKCIWYYRPFYRYNYNSRVIKWLYSKL